MEILADRVRFTETALAVLPGLGGDVDEVTTARHNAMFFSVGQTGGRLELNVRYAPPATSIKESAAFTTRGLLAAIPAGPHGHQYITFDLEKGQGCLCSKGPDQTCLKLPGYGIVFMSTSVRSSRKRSP